MRQFDRSIRAIAHRASVLQRRIRRPTSPRVRRLLGVLAFCVFGGAIWLAFLNLPPGLEKPRWEYFGVVAALGLPEIVLLGAEYQRIARLTGRVMRFVPAVEVAVVASAGNLLPLPGSLAIRTTDLVRRGSTVKSALRANALVGSVWVMLALMVSAAMIIRNNAIIGLSGLLIGAIALAVVVFVMNGHGSLAAVGGVVAVEASIICLAALRIFFIIDAIGADPTLEAVFLLVAAAILSTVVGIVPAGLGIREGLSALVAPLVALPAAVAVLVAGIDRILRLAVLGAVAAYIAVRPVSGTGNQSSISRRKSL